MTNPIASDEYRALLDQIKTTIRVVRVANAELVKLYWQIGRSGFSVRNFWKIRRFYCEYQQEEKLPQLVAEIPSGHHLEVMGNLSVFTGAYMISRAKRTLR